MVCRILQEVQRIFDVVYRAFVGIRRILDWVFIGGGYEGYSGRYVGYGIFGGGLEKLQIESHHFHSLFMRKRSAPALLTVCYAVVAE